MTDHVTILDAPPMTRTPDRSGLGGVIGMIFLPAVAVAVTGILAGWYFYVRSGHDFAAAYRQWHASYYWFLPAVLLAILPLQLIDLRKRGIVLGEHMIRRDRIAGDLGYGTLAAIVSLVLAVVWVRLLGVHLPLLTELPSTWLRVAVLVILAPPIKEIAFRLYPRLLLEPKIGAFGAWLVGTIAFALIDWQNMGASFIAGSIWYFLYTKRGSLFSAIVAHSVVNLLAIALG